MDRSSKEFNAQYDRKWIKMFKEACSDFNRTHTIKVAENPDNKGGYDYFSHPTITQVVTKKLGYEPKDVNAAKQRQIEQLLHNMHCEKAKCKIKL